MRTQTASWQSVRCAVALLFVFGASPLLCADAAPKAPSHATEDGPPDNSGGRVRPRTDGSVPPSSTANDAWTGEFLPGDDLFRQLEDAMRDVGLLETPATGEKKPSDEATLVKNQARPGLPEQPASEPDL
jgi:hypothetical protein